MGKSGENPNKSSDNTHLSGNGDFFTGLDVRQLKDRIKFCIGKETIKGFARKCNISEGALRHYLKGGEPGLSAFLSIAQTAGVSLEWLATGQGPIHPSKQNFPSNLNVLDKAIVREVAEEIENLLREYGLELEPAKKAELIVLLSEEIQEENSKMPRDKILRLIKLAA